MGIRRNLVYFEHYPNAHTIKEGMRNITGLSLIFDERWPNQLSVEHPQKQDCAVDIEWISNDERNYMRISSETPRWNYVEVSCLFLLKQIGGIIKPDIVLPNWAGQASEHFPPKGFWGKIRAKLDGLSPM